MMNNLFSIFDPSTTIMNFSLNWLSSLIGMMIIPLTFWMIPNRYMYLWFKIIFFLYLEFKLLLNPLYSKGNLLIFISIFSLIMFNNLIGLFPYIFTSTSHLILTLMLSMPLWFSFMIFGWMNNTNHMFTHLTPQGTPNILMPFMVCIETISNIIRPGTLAVRLSANMIAGHLLLTLLGNTGFSLSFYILNILIIVQLLLLILELAVSIIQSYVFSILSILYSSEIN